MESVELRKSYKETRTQEQERGKERFLNEGNSVEKVKIINKTIQNQTKSTVVITIDVYFIHHLS